MKRFFWSVLVIVFINCSGSDVPDGYLNKEEMANVMLDMYEVEVLMEINRSKIPGDKLYSVAKEEAFEKHHINDSIFKENLQYYLLNPEKFNEVYDIIIDSVKLRQEATNPPDPELSGSNNEDEDQE